MTRWKLTFIKISLMVCLLVLAKFILFKNSPGFYRSYFKSEYHSGIAREGWKKANLKPFATIQLFSRSRVLRTSYKVDNIGGNILGFVPVGFLICFLVGGRFRAIKVYLWVSFISFFFEATQLVTGFGVFDIDDLILNSFGGLLGILFYTITRSLFPAEEAHVAA